MDFIPRPCSIAGCDKIGKTTRGYCANHYKKWQRHGDPLAATNGKPFAMLEMLVDLEQDECWLNWPFARSHGRPAIKMGGKQHGASRLLCEWVHGAPPFRGAHAAHNCGDGGCLNPRHLRWATCQENQLDKVGHGTLAWGERNGNRKLTEEEIMTIRERRSLGKTTVALAAEYGVSTTQISRIARGVAWARLEIEELDARQD